MQTSFIPIKAYLPTIVNRWSLRARSRPAAAAPGAGVDRSQRRVPAHPRPGWLPPLPHPAPEDACATCPRSCDAERIAK